tara:strand:+ start:80 stop:946 length:867 start_codon:yes stop_codon:yes gene_type:complete
MAIKPINNKSLISSQLVNRGLQTSTKDINNRSELQRSGDSNQAMSFTPGGNLSENYAVTLKDIDGSVMNFIKNIIRPTIKENGEVFKVPIMYGNEERWKSARKRGVIRDKKGALLLPLIMFRRTEVSKNMDLAVGMEHDLRRNGEEMVVGRQWSKTNKYDRFSVLQGQKPVYEYLVTTVPNYVNLTYEFVLWTNFIEQMNPLVENFIEFNNQYWGEGLDTKFYSLLESISDASEMNQNGERFIKSTFSVTTKAYLLPEEYNSVVTNKISNLKTRRSPSKVVFSEKLIS